MNPVIARRIHAQQNLVATRFTLNYPAPVGRQHGSTINELTQAFTQIYKVTINLYPILATTLRITAWLFLVCSPSLYAAEDQQSSLLRSYTVEEFSKFAPRTALDVVNRIPGFSLDEEDEQRGFGQASSNVLINGARVAGKSNGVVAALERIPASSISRIDIHEGASLNIPGLSGEVVDIRVKTDELSGTWEWEMQYRERHDEVDPAWWKFNASMTGREGHTTWVLGLDNDYQRLGHSGPEEVFDGNGQVLESRDEVAAFDRDKPSITLGLNFAPASGNIGNLNLSYGQYWQHDVEQRDSDLPGGRRFQRKQNEWNAEISGDYEFDWLSGRLKIFGFQYYANIPAYSTTVEFEDGSNTLQNDFTSEKDSGESIVRVEYAWSDNNAGDWQWTYEGAYNFLDLESVFDSSLLSENIISDSKVEERRFEVTNTYSTAVNQRLSLQTSVGLETSRLEQTGDANKTRSFNRPKGFVSFGYQVNSRLNASFKVQRSVGQLDFVDFIASADLSAGTRDAGNPDIKPQQSWDYELALDQSLGDAGAATLRLYAEEIDDIVDQVPVGLDGQAPGNLDKAERYGAQLVSTLHFDQWGWPGSTFEIDMKTQKSRLKDPITGLTRRINEDVIRKYDFELRHDLQHSSWAWGVMHEVERLAPVFRVDRISHDIEGSEGITTLFVENKNIFGLTATFKLRNITDREDNFRREVYDGRRDGDLDFVEDRNRVFGLNYILVLSGTF